MPQSPLVPPSSISDPAADRLESLPADSDVRPELRTTAAGLLSELGLGEGQPGAAGVSSRASAL